jgi:hypothetical protein
MDGNRFDQLSRLLGMRLGRRAAVRGIAAVLAGGALASGPGRAAGASAPSRQCRFIDHSCLRGAQCCSGYCETRRTVARSRRNRCACPDGESRCAAGCRVLATDPANCGACGVACDASIADGCAAGACVCGSGPACGSGEACVSGACLPIFCTPTGGFNYCSRSMAWNAYSGCAFIAHYTDEFSNVPARCDADSECAAWCDPGAAACFCSRNLSAFGNEVNLVAMSGALAGKGHCAEVWTAGDRCV